MKFTLEEKLEVFLLILLGAAIFMLGHCLGFLSAKDKLKEHNYVQVEIKDKHGTPIPGYIGCECRMSGRKDRPGIYFWTTQNMKGQFDEIREGKTIPTDRGN